MNPIAVDDRSFSRLVLSADLPVVVDFGAAWCGPCRMIAPVVERLADRFGGSVRFFTADIGACPVSAGRYSVMSVPTLLVFHGGQVVQRFVGFSPSREAELTRCIENLTGVGSGRSGR